MLPSKRNHKAPQPLIGGPAPNPLPMKVFTSDKVNAVNIYFSTDWINYTALKLGTRVLTDVPYPTSVKQWSPALPAKGYRASLVNELGTKISWHDKRDDMGVHVQYTGQTLNKHAEQGITAQMIAQHHEVSGDRCSRVDLALDCQSTGLNIGALANMVKYGAGKFSTKVYSHITSQDSGETLYLGSRTSEQYIRIYNKAAEQQTSGDWVRIELELKGSRAHEVGKRLAFGTDTQMITLTRGMIVNMAQFPDETWKAIVGELAVSIAKAHTNEPDRKGWLLGLVAPAMGKYISESGDDAIIEQFLAIVDAFVRLR